MGLHVAYRSFVPPYGVGRERDLEFRVVDLGSPVSTCLPTDVTHPLATHRRAHPVHPRVELGAASITQRGRALRPHVCKILCLRGGGRSREEQIPGTGCPSGRRASGHGLSWTVTPQPHAAASRPCGYPLLVLPNVNADA